MENKELNNSSETKRISTNSIKKGFTWLKEAIKRTFKGHTKTTWIWIIFFIIIFIISILIAFIQYQDDTWLFDKVVRFFIIPMIELKAWGWIIFLIFMGIQGILVPIPSELVLLTSGLIWGLYGGSILGIIGSMLAGVLTYYIAVLGGRPMMEKFLGEENLDVLDFYIEKYGPVTIFLARAIPIFAFDPISYTSGFLKIKFRTYFIATLIGSIIRCIFYAWLGSEMYEGDPRELIGNPAEVEEFINTQATQFNTLLVILVIVLGSAFLFYQFLLMPYLERKYHKTKKDNSLKTENI